MSTRRIAMLFVSIYRDKGTTTEASEKRNLQLFANWKPPAGFEIKSHHAFADGTGGVLIAEAATAAALVEAAGPWGPFFDFETHPIIDVAESVPIAQRVYAWRDSVR
jgi:hypothetical protein